MDHYQISTEDEYRNALKEIEKRMSAVAGSTDGQKLDVLVTSVEAYEREHYSLGPIGDSSRKGNLRMRK